MIPKTISPTDLRKKLYAVVKDVATGKAQYLVTPNEGESVLICPRSEYDAIVEERQLLRDLRAAEADFKAGRTMTHEEVRKEFAKLIKRTPVRARKRRT
jgi:prevent-host-death family protein